MRAHIYSVLIGVTLAAGSTPAAAQPTVTVQVNVRPRVAPPAPREEAHEFRRGSVWVPGRWEWRKGKYEWTAGRYERVHAGKRWREPRWEEKNGEWVMADGEWIAADEYPTAAPPALREEKFENRPGQVWVRGRWEWQAGNWEWLPGRYERVRAGKHWREAHWDLKNGHYQLVEGDWEDAPRFPTAEPPALREEKFENRVGQVWVRGRWDWRNGTWEWMAGHYEKERPRMRWNEGRWERKGDHLEWVEGTWGSMMGDQHAVTVTLHPKMAPPALRDEPLQIRTGHVWIRGNYKWENGAYVWVPGHLEKVREKMTWHDPVWEHRGDEWVFVEGGWR